MGEQDGRTAQGQNYANQSLAICLTMTFMMWVAVFLQTPWWLFAAIPFTGFSLLGLWIEVDRFKHFN